MAMLRARFLGTGLILGLALSLGACASTRRTADPDAFPGELGWATELIEEGNTAAAIYDLQEFITENPGNRNVEEATFLLGRAFYEEGDHIEAEARFREVLRRYRGGDFEAQASYQLGLALLSQSLPPDRDQAETEAARIQFLTFVAQFPDHELVPRARDHVNTCISKLAQKAYGVCELYHKRGRNYEKATRYSAEKVVDTYSDTIWAAKAMLILAKSYRRTKQWPEVIRWSQTLIAVHGDTESAEEARALLQEAGKESVPVDDSGSGESALDDPEHAESADTSSSEPD